MLAHRARARRPSSTCWEDSCARREDRSGSPAGPSPPILSIGLASALGLLVSRSQTFNLLPAFSAVENVALPLRLMDMPGRTARRRAAEVLEALGLRERPSASPKKQREAASEPSSRSRRRSAGSAGGRADSQSQHQGWPRCDGDPELICPAGTSGLVVSTTHVWQTSPTASSGSKTEAKVLADGRWQLLALTMGAAEATRGLLERAGVADLFEGLLSCDSISVTKPNRAAYELALERFAGETWMVAAHAWDIAGAARAGLRTAFITSVEGSYLEVYPKPDLRAKSLLEAARAMIEP